MTRTITAYFDSRTEAQTAADRLTAESLALGNVDIHDSSSATATSTGQDDKGFWASLGDLFVPDEDRHTYEEGFRRGGSMLSVRAEDAEFERVSDILEDAGAVDLDSREAEWRSEGWSGYDANAATPVAGTAGYGATTSDATRDMRTGVSGEARDREDYIPVAEESLRVGKREVDHGRVRIRSYVVETPVEEHVSLRQETVHLDRNPVDRAAAAGDRLFEERSIEAEEHSEEAVVSKEARVVEEVRLSKDVQERDQTVSDTVRRTEVEIEDERTGSTLSDEDRIRTGRSN